MEFIVAQSSSPVGSTVRVHIENPSEGTGGGAYFIMPITASVSLTNNVTGYVESIEVQGKIPKNKLQGSVKKVEINAIIKENKVKGVVR